MNAVLDTAIWFAQACFAIATALAAIRVIQGPAAQDRVLAFDTMYINGMLSLLMLGMRSSSSAYFDMALLIALFGFAGSVALAKFLLRGEVIEP
ncbi:MAG: K+/H+ antiporter subunit F [Xanthomonadaceae bacterium]|nr:K+/H+ antiporter subunit F [Xanthomonadaceae bacterium]